MFYDLRKTLAWLALFLSVLPKALFREGAGRSGMVLVIVIATGVGAGALLVRNAEAALFCAKKYGRVGRLATGTKETIQIAEDLNVQAIRILGNSDTREGRLVLAMERVFGIEIYKIPENTGFDGFFIGTSTPPRLLVHRFSPDVFRHEIWHRKLAHIREQGIDSLFFGKVKGEYLQGILSLEELVTFPVTLNALSDPFRVREQANSLEFIADTIKNQFARTKEDLMETAKNLKGTVIREKNGTVSLYRTTTDIVLSVGPTSNDKYYAVSRKHASTGELISERHIASTNFHHLFLQLSQGNTYQAENWRQFLTDQAEDASVVEEVARRLHSLAKKIKAHADNPEEVQRLAREAQNTIVPYISYSGSRPQVPSSMSDPALLPVPNVSGP